MQSSTLRPRRDGWTPAAQATFIAAREGGATIAAAAAAAGMSRQAAYKLRAHPAGGAVRAMWHPPVPTLTADQVDAALERMAGVRRAPALSDAALLHALRKTAPRA